MIEHTNFLTDEERAACAAVATRNDLEGQRARAILAIDEGASYAAAAEVSGLTPGQVEYFLRKFREQRLSAFSDEVAETAAEVASAHETYAAPPETPEAEGDTPAEAAQLRALVDELNALVVQLNQALDEQDQHAPTPYSPAGLLVLLRDSARKLTPEAQKATLQAFESMTVDDMLDLETWKGLAYMFTYSARFQAEQVRDRVNHTINEVVPEPVQPARLWQISRQAVDKITPDVVKQIAGTFEGATREDLLDPDTWKGVWYMLSYSIQFQAEQWKQRLIEANEGTAEPE